MIGLLLRSLVYCFLCGVPSLASAVDTKAIELYESQIKAIYLFKFASYVEWPSSTFLQADSPFTIGIMGSEAVAAELRQMSANQQIANRPITITSLKPTPAIEDLSSLQVLFISQESSRELAPLIAGIQPKPVLIVTETPGALKAGSMINFVPVDEHIRFEISLASAEQHQLKIGSRLLSVAQKVQVRSPQ